LHVRTADEAVCIGPAPPRESYLDADAVIRAARATRADAIHPGYGFLSEDAAFAEACHQSGIQFVGPPASAIRSMGLKHEAKAIVSAAGVPIVPGYMGEHQSERVLKREAERVGFPLLVKAVAGGGGKGMRVVRNAIELPEAIRGARSEAENAFGDGRLMLERFLERPRHIEVQVFGDGHGNCLHLFERECSVQRRFQKIIEESPSPFINANTRAAMTTAAVRAAKAAGYVNAGTVEFIVSAAGDFYFMEMNTRLQVEHPVTEAVTGLDLVEWQLKVAAGERLPLAQEELRQQGHAIEARIYSEDPRRGFLPSTGKIERFACPPPDAHWRIDQGVEDGDTITVYYDPMIAKVIASSPDRAAALAVLRDRLARTAIFGVSTNLPLLREIAMHPQFAAGDVDTGFVDRELEMLTRPALPAPESLLLAAQVALDAVGPNADDAGSPWSCGDAWRMTGAARQAIGLRTPSFLHLRVSRHGARIEVLTPDASLAGSVLPAGDSRYRVDAGAGPREIELIRHGAQLQIIGSQTDEISLTTAWPFDRSVEDADTHPASPLPGRIVELRAKVGDTVARGDVLAIVEGMKMQHAIKAGRAGRIASVFARAGELVDADTVLFDIEPA
ncbi:MAG: acetyl/propionyl/methylcrotonyl-CoA carboxylase subunit alpha, partial [Steroidobacteraceae bacterium]